MTFHPLQTQSYMWLSLCSQALEAFSALVRLPWLPSRKAVSSYVGGQDKDVNASSPFTGGTEVLGGLWMD